MVAPLQQIPESLGEQKWGEKEKREDLMQIRHLHFPPRQSLSQNGRTESAALASPLL